MRSIPANIVVAVLCMARMAYAEEADQATQFFEQQVHPILAKRCYECHGAEKQESGLRLDSREAVLAGGDSENPSAIPGDPSKSLLIEAIRHDGESELRMPPDEKIPDAEIAVLVEWVKMGLPWDKSAPATKILTPMELAVQARKEHWSLQPVSSPKLPAVKDSSWPSRALDYHVLKNLEAAGIKPSSAADRRTLIRRLSFDLWGLPPSDQEVQEFVQDSAPDAYARLVDRWLASPAYGERWGRHWLDVARYADTRGYAFANDRRYPYAYTYRDYVIGAFNSDKPYDEFVLEQLAADQLPIGEDKTRLAAMGFLTTGRKFNNRQDDLDDQIDVVSRGLLGLTVACARCHDHKYDPVPTEDYYSLYGVFASSQEPDDLPLIAEPKQGKAYEEFQKELEKRRGELEAFRTTKHAEVVKQSRERVATYLGRLVSDQQRSRSDRVGGVSLDRNDVRPRLLERWRGFLNAHAKPDDAVLGPWKELVSLSDSEFAGRVEGVVLKWRQMTAGTKPGQINPIIQSKLFSAPLTAKAEVADRYAEALVQAFEKWTAAGANEEAFSKLPEDQRQLAMIIAGKDSPTDIPAGELSSYLNRADRNQFREFEKKIQSFQASSPAAPPRAMVLKEDDRPHDPRVFLRGNAARPGKQVPRQFLLVMAGTERKPFQQRSGRLELAQKIVDPGNPLTRRVIANRVWMHHFGQSLVRTPSDFGVRCEQPVQAQLLDHLASQLLERDWSIKALHREILLSSTYQQASLYRAEASVKDPENRLLWRMNRRRLEFEPLRDSLLAVSGGLDSSAGGRPVELFKAPFSGRRTVYGNIDRQDLPNLLRVFDFPSPDQSQADRPRTSVPQQALFLMNSPFVIEQSQRLAASPYVSQTQNDDEKIAAYFRIVFQRQPSSAEIDWARTFVQKVEQDQENKTALSAWEQFAQLLLLTNEFAYVD